MCLSSISPAQRGADWYFLKVLNSEPQSMQHISPGAKIKARYLAAVQLVTGVNILKCWMGLFLLQQEPFDQHCPSQSRLAWFGYAGTPSRHSTNGVWLLWTSTAQDTTQQEWFMFCSLLYRFLNSSCRRTIFSVRQRTWPNSTQPRLWVGIGEAARELGAKHAVRGIVEC